MSRDIGRVVACNAARNPRHAADDSHTPHSPGRGGAGSGQVSIGEIVHRLPSRFVQSSTATVRLKKKVDRKNAPRPTAPYARGPL